MIVKFAQSIFLVLSLALTMNTCGGETATKKSSDNKDGLNISFLSKQEAESRIIKDATDGFFESLTYADISIQLKSGDVGKDLTEAKQRYADFLKSDMMDFTEEDKAFLKDVFTEAKRLIEKVNPALYPKDIELVKTDINHYGEDVYYTRENMIIIPSNIFEEKNVDVQKNVMMHEIFHILSRYNDDFRDALYALIGFHKFDSKIEYPEVLQNKILTNPDGVRTDYAIHLKDKAGRKQLALPIISSRRERYSPEVPSFFSYLNFDLYPIICDEDGGNCGLGANEKGESTLSIEHNAHFFELIKDNTTYIIHPDEIMAENFMLSILAYDVDDFNTYSEEGQVLLKDVLKVLINHGK